MKWARYLFAASGILATMLFMAVYVAYLEGMTCEYQVSFKFKNNGSSVVTCSRGSAIEINTKRDKQGNILSQWKVVGRQLRLGNQIIMLAYDRSEIHSTKGYTDKSNVIKSGYRLFFYHAKQQGDRFYVYAKFPRVRMSIGRIKGNFK